MPKSNDNMEELTLSAAQKEVDRWIQDIGKGYFSELTNLGVLMEEVGELSRIMVRRYGDQKSKQSDLNRNLSEEMADVLWVLMALANQTGVDLTVAFRESMEKKTIRDKGRFG